MKHQIYPGLLFGYEEKVWRSHNLDQKQQMLIQEKQILLKVSKRSSNSTIPIPNKNKNSHHTKNHPKIQVFNLTQSIYQTFLQTRLSQGFIIAPSILIRTIKNYHKQSHLYNILQFLSQSQYTIIQIFFMNVLAGGCGQFRLPFVDNQVIYEPKQSYWQMLAHCFCPYFKFASISFMFVIMTFTCLLIPQFIFPSSGQSRFLQYRLIPHVYLTPIEIKHISHAYIYEAATSMFFHTGWPHWLSNMFGIILNVITMEYCWFPSIFFMLLGGFIANCYYVLSHDNSLMGFSGVIACSIGLYIGMFIGNWSYLRRYPSEMMMVWFINCIFVFFLLFSYSPTSTLVHFLGFGIGVIYGIAWIPKPAPDNCQLMTGTVCKIVSILISILPILLIFMHPTGTFTKQTILV